MTSLPSSIDLMPSEEPDLPLKRVIAIGLNSVPYEAWPSSKKGRPAMVSEDSVVVRAVERAIRLAGMEIVVRKR